MGELGTMETVMIAVVAVGYAAAIGLPAAIICRRIGRPFWFGVFALIPILNIVLLWFVATTRWEPEFPQRAG